MDWEVGSEEFSQDEKAQHEWIRGTEQRILKKRISLREHFIQGPGSWGKADLTQFHQREYCPSPIPHG